MEERTVFSCRADTKGLSYAVVSVRAVSGNCLTKQRKGEGRGAEQSLGIRYAFALPLPSHQPWCISVLVH